MYKVEKTLWKVTKKNSIVFFSLLAWAKWPKMWLIDPLCIKLGLPGKLFGACIEGHSLCHAQQGLRKLGRKGGKNFSRRKSKTFSFKRLFNYVHSKIFRPSVGTRQKNQTHYKVAISKRLSMITKSKIQVNSKDH